VIRSRNDWETNIREEIIIGEKYYPNFYSTGLFTMQKIITPRVRANKIIFYTQYHLP
jgi:hypothetical protein